MEEIDIIVDKVNNNRRISIQEAVILYEKMPLFELANLAIKKKREKSGDMIFYNKNFHVEPTNICQYRCKFCSYRKNEGEVGGWNMSMEEITDYVAKRMTPTITEVHLVGGVNSSHTLEHYCNVIAHIRGLVGERVQIKAFSAVEHIAMIDKAGLSYREGIERLVAAGMDTITGGGAEIFDEEIRAQICPDKASSVEWLRFHETAHNLGIKTNATMLYGHIESVYHRFEHMERLRALQDETGGFTTFIPLKFRSKNNDMSYAGETSLIDDMKTLSLSRIFLDNFSHLKAYSPMYGKERTQQAILFGADDIDGTVKDSTKIYSMAGVESHGMDEEDMIKLIEETGFKATERDTFYNIIS